MPDAATGTRDERSLTGGPPHPEQTLAGEGNASPDSDDATPDEAGASPDSDDATPDEGDASPDEAGASPDEGDASPDEAGASPDEADTPSDSDDATPDEADTPSDSDGATPGDDAAATDADPAFRSAARAPGGVHSEHAVMLFDGVCNLCNSTVNFVIDRDPEGEIKLASLQSDAAKPLLARHGIDTSYLDGVVLIYRGRCWTQSTAALQVARRLRWPWPLLFGLIIIPRFLRDWVYAWIARNRYHWFGKQESCRMPTPELRARFL